MRALADYLQKKNTDELFEELNIERARERWERLDAQRLYKIRNADKFPKVPGYMRNLLTTRAAIREPRTKSETSNIVSVCKMTDGERMLARRLWKLDLKLPREIWTSTCISSFLKSFKLALRM